jgi:hypothetical protein
VPRPSLQHQLSNRCHAPKLLPSTPRDDTPHRTGGCVLLGKCFFGSTNHCRISHMMCTSTCMPHLNSNWAHELTAATTDMLMPLPPLECGPAPGCAISQDLGRHPCPRANEGPIVCRTNTDAAKLQKISISRTYRCTTTSCSAPNKLPAGQAHQASTVQRQADPT